MRAQAQIPGLSASPAAAAPSLFVNAPITVDGFTVLTIAALTNPSPGEASLSSRQLQIQSAISEVLAVDPESDDTVYDPATFRVKVQRDSGDYALVASDARHTTPFPIVTVTSEDSRYANLTQQELATQWQGQLQSKLEQALVLRQPQTLKRARTILNRGAIGLAIVTILGIIFFRAIKNRRLAAIIAWVLAILWLLAITYALWLFPQTLSYGQYIARAIFSIVLIVVISVIADWLLGFVVVEGVRAVAVFRVAPGAQARSLLRVPTMSKALNGFKRFLIIFIALLAALSSLQIPIASVVTIGGIAAVAVGFAAQSLVRDFLNGLLVLFEDQYVVGDYVAIGTFNGIVEQFTLRVVQIRDSQGNLITIPHSNVTQVVNSSRNWSRIDYKLPIDAGADIEKAFSTLKATIDSIKDDPDWKGAIIEPYEWMGVDTISKGGMMLRAVVRTAPLRQFDVRREINRRVASTFRDAQVPLGFDAATTLVTPMTQSPDPA